MVDDWVSIGSCNFDHWNLRFNLEGNLEARDQGLLEQVHNCLINDFEQSIEVTEETWQQRPLFERVRQRLWGWMDRREIHFLDSRQ